MLTDKEISCITFSELNKDMVQGISFVPDYYYEYEDEDTPADEVAE